MTSRFSIPNIKRMTPKARDTARKDLRVSSLSGMSTKKIISVILLLSLPKNVSASSISGLLSAATAFGTFLAPVIQRVSAPAAYAGMIKVASSEAKSFLNDSNTKIYSAIAAAITVILLLQRVYASRTERMRITLERNRLAHNAEQRRLNREASREAMNRQLQLFNRIVQGQGMMVKQAVQEAVLRTQPMLLQLEEGKDPVIPIPRITGSSRSTKSKQN